MKPTRHILTLSLLTALVAGCGADETTEPVDAGDASEDTPSDGGSGADAGDDALADADTGSDAENDTDPADVVDDATDGDAAPDDATDTGDSETTDPDAGDSQTSDADIDTAVDVPEFDADPSEATLDGPCRSDNRVGAFKVEMNEDLGYTAIDGVVRNGVSPAAVTDNELSSGDCSLLRRRRLVCNPVCAPGQTCDVDGTCIPAPVGQDQGTVTVQGLVSPVSLEPLPPGNNYFFTRLAHPGFGAGDPILLTSTLGYFGTLELWGVGVTQLQPSDELWTINEGLPLDLAWTADSVDERTRVFVELNIDQHGLTPVTATCDFADDGAAQIPADIIDGLIAAGVTGFPSGRVTRRTVDSQTRGDECVEFVVSSIRTIGVEVTGFVPCTTTADCPDGTSCVLAIQQCQ